MKVSKRDAALLIGLLGVIIAGLTYYFIYMNYSEKAKQLEADNRVLAQRVQVLQELSNKRESMLNEISEYTEKAGKILDRFPADVKEDDAIMYAVKLQDEAPIEYISSVRIGAASDIYTMQDVNALAEARAAELLGNTSAAPAEEAPAEEAENTDAVGEAVEGLANDYSLKSRAIDISMVSTYEGFKNGIKMITGRNDRTQLTLSAAYDIETGLVAAQFSLLSDYIEGSGRSYVQPQVPYIQKGTDNIFGTVELTTENSGGSEESEEAD